jgi:hypothetical protein
VCVHDMCELAVLFQEQRSVKLTICGSTSSGAAETWKHLRLKYATVKKLNKYKNTSGENGGQAGCDPIRSKDSVRVQRVNAQWPAPRGLAIGLSTRH